MRFAEDTIGVSGDIFKWKRKDVPLRARSPRDSSMEARMEASEEVEKERSD